MFLAITAVRRVLLAVIVAAEMHLHRQENVHMSLIQRLLRKQHRVGEIHKIKNGLLDVPKPRRKP